MEGSDLWPLYHPRIPPLLRHLADTAPMARLRQVGMNCGCEYTDFPRFRGLPPYSRFRHSMGVGLIVWHFTHDNAQAAAGLLHDIATPVFAHVVDFLNGDHLTQTSTEGGTAALIAGDPGIRRTLSAYHLTPEQVWDYHRYPIADNNSPRLSADRLEYTLGNAVNYGFLTLDQARTLYRDLTVAPNEEGAPELAFRTRAAASAFAGAVGLKMVTQYLNQYFLTKAGMKVVMDLRNVMFRHLQVQSLAFHGRSDVGKLMSRATGDPAIVQTIISSTMSDLCRAPFEVITSVVFVCGYAVAYDMLGLLLITVVGYPLCMVPVVWLGRRIRRWTARMLEQSAGVGSNFHENLTCIRVVKAYNTEASETEKYRLANLRQYKMNMRAVRLSILVGPLTELVAILLAGVFLIMCAWQGLTFVEIVPLLPPFLILYKPMKQIGRIQIALENGRAALQRIFSLLDVHEELVERPDALPLKTFADSIVFDHVDFAYSGRGELTVRDANFTIRRGQMFAVVGSTGSGKSTLANLLARFYDVTGGRVLLDGHDIRDYRLADLRAVIGAVTQESILFNDTIAANIAYGSPGATREQIVEAAKLANAHAFITAHPEGYDRVVGEKGFVLSGGERQRVAIARAILRNPPILILDEATSALDTVTEQQVQAAINNLMKNRTIFAIAHRLSTIRNADCILVLERGEIKERGTHDELYAKGGIYRRLCDIQNREQTER